MRAVNLLPPDLRSGPKGPAPAVASGEKTSGAGAFIVLGVLAFCVLAMAAYVLSGNTVKDRQAELARATAETAAVAGGFYPALETAPLTFRELLASGSPASP